MENNSPWALKIGLFIVVLTWLAYTLFTFGRFLITGVDVPFTDVPGRIGFGFRTASAFLAFITVLFYSVKRDFSRTEAINTTRWIVLLEAAYWIMFLPAAVWGFQQSTVQFSQEFFIIEAGLPCLVEAIVMPTVLIALFFKLNPNKPAEGFIKWVLIVVAAEILVFWFNYTSQWWAEIYYQGTGFLGQSHVAILEFIMTTVGLLLLGAYAAIFTTSAKGTRRVSDLNFRKGGAILTLLGLYFDLILLFWIVFPFADGTLTIWAPFIIDHNVDLWMATLPLIGVPLMFYKKPAMKNQPPQQQ